MRTQGETGKTYDSATLMALFRAFDEAWGVLRGNSPGALSAPVADHQRAELAAFILRFPVDGTPPDAGAIRDAAIAFMRRRNGK